MAAKKPSAARIKKLASNPATRAALEDKYLSPAQLKQRQLNQRLDTPVTPGSSLTVRDLAHQAQNATTVQYGPSRQQLGEGLQNAQQFQTNVGSWYDQYQKDLQAARDRIAQNNTDANTAFQNLVGAVGKLGTGVEGTNEQGNAANAASVRQQLLGSFAAQQNENGRASNNYAEGLANIVAPGERVTALSDAGRRIGTVRDRLAELAREEGAFNQKFRTDTTADEAKNVLATAIATGKNTVEKERLKQSSPEGKAAAAGATAEARTAAKYGRTLHQWRLLGPDGRQKIIDAGKSKPADSTYTSGPFAGKTKSEVSAMTPKQRQQIVDDYNKTKGPGGKPKSAATQGAEDFYSKYGVKPASQAKVDSAQTQIDRAKSWIGTLKAQKDDKGQPLSPATIRQLLTQGQAADKKNGITAIPALSDLWVSVAMDLAGPTHRVSNATANRLHHAGYSVKALGLPSMSGVITSPIKGGAGAGQ